jgi:hypothetical protein
MSEVWHCQGRVLLRAPVRFRRRVPPGAPPLQRPENPATATRTHESLALAGAGVHRGVGPDVLISSRIATRFLRRPHPPADPQRPAPGWTRARRSGGVWRGWWLRRRIVGRRQHAPAIRRVDGPAGAQKANMSYLHEARGQDVWQEPAHKLQDVEWGGARACAAGLAVRERTAMVLERDKMAVGEGPFEAIRSKVRPGRGAGRVDLAGHAPGGGQTCGAICSTSPAVGMASLQSAR